MNYSVTIYALRHNEKWIIIPDKKTVLEAGDVILASGSSSGISLLKLDSTKSIKTIKNNMERGSKFFKQHCRQIVSQYSTSKVGT